MKIIRLAPDRIRVVLSEGDLSNMKIDAKALTPDSPKLSVFLCNILAAVREETGFSAEDGQIVAEAITGADGMILELSHAPKDRRGGYKEEKVVKKDSIMFEIVGFDSLAGMLKNISPTHLLSMRLYTCDGKFYIAVPKRRIPAILYEYSLKNRRSAVAESKIAEYGRLIAGGYRLICMASALKKMN